MKLIVGLGNPGEKYHHTRHNAGFMVLNALRIRLKLEDWRLESKFEAEVIKTKDSFYAKPQTYMNDSGRSVAAIARFYKIKPEEIYIVHDDLDIALGNFKIQHGKGPQVHNGLLSIEQSLGTDQFWNVRVGVENRVVRGNSGIPGVEYSLQNFSPEEKMIVEDVIGRVVDRLTVL